MKLISRMAFIDVSYINFVKSFVIGIIVSCEMDVLCIMTMEYMHFSQYQSNWTLIIHIKRPISVSLMPPPVSNVSQL